MLERHFPFWTQVPREFCENVNVSYHQILSLLNYLKDSVEDVSLNRNTEHAIMISGGILKIYKLIKVVKDYELYAATPIDFQTFVP